jgi:hypothetical protein
MEFLGTPWPTITSALRKAKKRIAVTPYLNGDAFRMLPLRKAKDVLVVDACERNVRAGLTNPREIEKFMDAKVQCFTVDDLHAKGYLADKTVFVGSMNASTHSRDTLIEACLQVRSAGVAAQFESWLASLALVPLTAERLAELKDIYKPAKWGKAGSYKPRTSAAWVLTIDRDDDSEETEEYLDEVAASNDIGSDEIYAVTVSKRSRAARFARQGDEFFILDHRGRIKALPPMRLIEPAKLIASRYRLALKDSDQPSVPFGAFLRVIRRIYPRFPVSGKSARSIRPAAAAQLRKMWR